MRLSRAQKLLVFAIAFELACFAWAHGFAREDVGLVAGQSSHAAHALTQNSIAMCVTAIAAQMTATLVGPAFIIACMLHVVLLRISFSRFAAKKAGKKA